MVGLPQKHSTGNGRVPGPSWGFIMSVGDKSRGARTQSQALPAAGKCHPYLGHPRDETRDLAIPSLLGLKINVQGRIITT